MRRLGGRGLQRLGAVVQEHQQVDALPFGLQLLRHLEGDQAAKTASPEPIGAGRLQRADFLEVMRGDLLHLGEGLLLDLQAPRLQPIERLLRSQMPRQIGQEQRGPRRDTEERPPGAAGLDRHQGSPGQRPPFLAEEGG